MESLLEQYLRIKNDYKDELLFFRLGDFYELFFEDAKVAAQLLGLALTSREFTKNKRIPMAGVPVHAANIYINRLLREGYRIAICEQLTEPSSRGIIERSVVRVLTPGTAMLPEYLDEARHLYLACIAKYGDWGFAYVDVSSGEFQATVLRTQEDLLNEVQRVRPAECLISESMQLDDNTQGIYLTPLPQDYFELSTCRELLCEQFGVIDIDVFGCGDIPAAVIAAGVLIRYLGRTQREILQYIEKLSVYRQSEFMYIDRKTLQQLEIFRSTEEQALSLVEILRKTNTPMGSRLLQRWLSEPLISPSQIKKRQDAVTEIYNMAQHEFNLLVSFLKEIKDMERIVARLTIGIGTTRELLQLSASLKQIPKIKEIIKDKSSDMLIEIFNELEIMEDICNLIDNSIVPSPQDNLHLIKEGYDQQLDRLRDELVSAQKFIADLQAREIQRTGISSLKVGYHKVFGYYIEISKPNLKYVPKDYIRKQTLSNAERFVTFELKEKEAFILAAREQLCKLQNEIISKIISQVLSRSLSVKRSCRAIAKLDVLSAFAYTAHIYNYSPPQINDSDVILIKEGRHPVLEVLQKNFVANDTILNCSDHQILIITGPNMAGKSTYIRQVALIVLLAQVGSWVPAKSATIGVVDAIFTRIGGFDVITQNKSTFMVEMMQTAQILNCATKKSLIILDEIGRGTSTYDGLSIAWAVIEYLHEHIKAKTLFATHYHKLIYLQDKIKGVRNYHMAVKAAQDKITFLYKVVDGGTSKSYGVEVARLAGLPQKVIQRARCILKNLEVEDNLPLFEPLRDKSQMISQSPQEDKQLYKLIKEINIENMTPLAALNELAKLKKLVEDKDFES